MSYTKQQLKEIENAVTKKLKNLETLKIEEVEEPIFVEQVELGEIEEENFYEAVTKMGLPYIKKGRIPFKEVEEITPTTLEFFKKSTSPKTDIKDVLKMKTKEGISKINGRIEKTKKIRQRDKQSTIERNNRIHDELNKLESKKVKVNQNLMWSLYTIMRGRKRLEYFEENGDDIELLKLQNSFIDEETMSELKELRGEYYES